MRPSRDQYGLLLARTASLRSTCYRRHVGCVLTDARGHVLSIGNNGVHSGAHHCNHAEYVDGVVTYPHICGGALSPSGTNIEGCGAIHAEQNALLQCRDAFAIHTAYVTVTPCNSCTKLLLGTSCQRIVAADTYPDVSARELWQRSGRSWEIVDLEQWDAR
jgi:dCMP deaminase